MPKIKMSNEMLVRDLMNYSDHGVLAQVFVVEAIRHYAAAIVSKNRPKEDNESFIDPAQWWDIAADTLNRIEENFNAPSAQEASNDAGHN